MIQLFLFVVCLNVKYQRMREIVNLLPGRVKWLLFVCFCSLQLWGQDLHYSQFYNSPQNVNPALTGMFQGTYRYTGSMRDQWRFVPVPWFTMSGAFDTKFAAKNNEKLLFGAGLNLNHDRQGDSKMNLSTLNLQLATHYVLSPKHIFSGGLTLGFASRGFDTRSLTWDKQWDGEVFNGNWSSGEAFGALERIYFLETGFGLNYRYQRSPRTYVDMGTSVLHLLEPNQAFYSNRNAHLPQRYSLSLISSLRIADALDLQIHALQQYQASYEETLVGALVKFYLSQARGKQIHLHAGLGYRTSESLIPTAAIQYNNIYVGLSYDVDTNNYNDIVGSNKGGLEVHVRYIFTKVESLRNAKVCPIY